MIEQYRVKKIKQWSSEATYYAVERKGRFFWHRVSPVLHGLSTGAVEEMNMWRAMDLQYEQGKAEIYQKYGV